MTRLATALNDDRHFSHALAVLFCIGGVPSVYYGDEQGFRGLKEHREGGDDEIRPAFPATPAGLLPDGWRYYRLHQRLIGFRRRHPWLVRARTAAAYLEPSVLALRLRGEGPGEQALLLLKRATRSSGSRWTRPASPSPRRRAKGDRCVPTRCWSRRTPGRSWPTSARSAVRVGVAVRVGEADRLGPVA